MLVGVPVFKTEIERMSIDCRLLRSILFYVLLLAFLVSAFDFFLVSCDFHYFEER